MDGLKIAETLIMTLTIADTEELTKCTLRVMYYFFGRDDTMSSMKKIQSCKFPPVEVGWVGSGCELVC